MKITLKNITIGALLIAINAMSGCKKDSTLTPTNSTNNGSGITSFQAFFKAMGAPTQNFTINASTGGSFTGLKGTKFTFYSNSFLNSSNALVTGNVNIQLREIYSKEDMLFSNMPTTSGNQPLLSGGEYYLSVSQNNQPLHMVQNKNYQAIVPMIDTLNLYIYTGKDSAGYVTNWARNFDSLTSISNVIPSYLVKCDSIGEINLDCAYPGPFYSDSIFTPNRPVGCPIYIFLLVKGKYALWSSVASTSNPNKFKTGYTLPVNTIMDFVAISITPSGVLYTSIVPTNNPGYSQNITMTFSQSDTATFRTQVKALQ